MTLDLKLALHTWTINSTPLAVALEAAKAAGFDAVELRRSDFVRCFNNGETRGGVVDRYAAAVSGSAFSGPNMAGSSRREPSNSVSSTFFARPAKSPPSSAAT